MWTRLVDSQGTRRDPTLRDATGSSASEAEDEGATKEGAGSPRSPGSPRGQAHGEMVTALQVRLGSESSPPADRAPWAPPVPYAQHVP